MRLQNAKSPRKKGSYVAIIGDIKNSRQSGDREQVQKQLDFVLAKVNEKYGKEIAANFLITLGDEFQGLLFQGDDLMDIIFLIKSEMYPVQIRFGIGIGTIATDIIRERAIGADGPAYYMAREAIESVKENEKKNKSSETDMEIRSEDGAAKELLLLNQLFALLYVVERSWNERQKEIIWDMLQHRDGQAAVAKRKSITQPTVQRSLSTGSYYTYQNAFDTVKSVISSMNNA